MADIWLFLKAIDAILAVVVLCFIIPKFPKILSFSGSDRLALINQVLQKEVNERKQAEIKLKQLNESLEKVVELETMQLQATLAQLQGEIREREKVEKALRCSECQLQEQNQQLRHTLQELRNTQAQLIQSEKMSGLGQMVAGIAHEINNPINFIYGNLQLLQTYMRDLLQLLLLYREHYPDPPAIVREISEEVDIEFLTEDLPNSLHSMQVGTQRIHDIVKSLRNFSRLDEAEKKKADLHEGIDSTLMILQHRLKANGDRPEIQICKHYNDIPEVECHPSQLNQVFMNLLANAIDAIEDRYSDNPTFIPEISIQTQLKQGNEYHSPNWIEIRILDNGCGMSEETKNKLFEPFFTTKPIGKGTGLGGSISYQIIVEKHRGKLRCKSERDRGTEFIIELPVTLSESRSLANYSQYVGC